MLCFRASGACVFLNDVKIDPRDAATSMVPQQPRLQGWALPVTRGWTMTMQGCWFPSDSGSRIPVNDAKMPSQQGKQVSASRTDSHHDT